MGTSESALLRRSAAELSQEERAIIDQQLLRTRRCHLPNPSAISALDVSCSRRMRRATSAARLASASPPIDSEMEKITAASLRPAGARKMSRQERIAADMDLLWSQQQKWYAMR